MLRVGAVLHGVYRIDRYLSSGGFGNTYVATNIEFDEQYAVKEFFMSGVSQRDANNTTVSVSNSKNRDVFASQLEKFKKEARRLRKLHNPHIVKVHDLFEENGTAYYVMDYIDGENLSAYLRRTGGPMPEAEVMRILPQILDALDAAHSAGILHLDLKPANIMLDKQGNALLIDFGASKQQSNAGGATTSSAVSYTNGYAPREQMEQNLTKFGPWTDFYALGATLYNLLTSKKPPLPSDIDDDKSPDKHEALPMPPQISAATKNLVLWLMTTDRAARPQSVAEIRSCMSGGDDTIIKNQKQTRQRGKTPPMLPAHKRNNRKKWIVTIAAIAAVVGLVFMVRKPSSVGNAPEKAQSEKNADSYSTEILADETITVGGVSFVMKGVQGGEFTMGATPEQGDSTLDDEKPVHRVAVSSFRIGQTEVTQALWKAVMGSNPSSFEGDNLPVDNVSWSDCQEFIGKLNSLTGKDFRLPTEAEWEYAARGGNKSQGYKFSGSNDSDKVAWYDGNSDNTTHEVGTKSPNELGLYDMSGNVWEWCNDWYDDYNPDDQTNPTGPGSGSNRVYRGGAWNCYAKGCRVSGRCYFTSDYRVLTLGLRLAL